MVPYIKMLLGTLKYLGFNLTFGPGGKQRIQPVSVVLPSTVPVVPGLLDLCEPAVRLVVLDHLDPCQVNHPNLSKMTYKCSNRYLTKSYH